MKKWYKAPFTKGILITLEHIFAVALACCLVFLFTYPSRISRELVGRRSRAAFEETDGFISNMQMASVEIMEQMRRKERLETDGQYDPNKLVDIKEYAASGKITGDSKSVLTYRLGDLARLQGAIDWYEEGTEVVVCQNKDTGYTYYTMQEFIDKVKTNEFRLWHDGDEAYEENLKERIFMEDIGEEETPIRNASDELLYTGFWRFEQAVPVEIKTAEGKSVLQIANEETEWNGKLTEICNDLRSTVVELGNEVDVYDEMKQKWSEGNTNLTYLFADFKNNRLYSNRQQYNNIQKADSYIEAEKKAGKYVIAAPKLADFQTNLDTTAEDWCQTERMGTGNYRYLISVDTKYPIQDSFYTMNKTYQTYAPYANLVMVVGIISLIGFFAALVWLTVIAGCTEKDGEIKLTWFDKIKTEIAAVSVFGVWLCVMMLFNLGFGIHLLFRDNAYVKDSVFMSIAALVTCGGFLTGYLSLVRRIKAKTLWENSVMKALIELVKQFLRYRSYTWKAMAAAGAFLLVHWVAFIAKNSVWIFALGAEAAAFYFLLKEVIARKKLQKGIEEIKEGNLDYTIPLDGLKGDNREMADNINNIGEGLSRAVEQSMKDERLKTDLITNVSHDIKTPLTSIINYVDLLKREHMEDPKIQGYLDILEAKSQRLKTLTEDVVEASKISSGNISLEYRDIDFAEMIRQTTGEFDEKFAKKNLQIILNLPEHPVMIHADGRRMWRVIENIYNNAAKYALEGTRVYADLIEKEQSIEFSLKNISEQPLNISAEELTERFIRGDVSRSTEGSGLGLSIAENLTKMQGGEFKLYLDGDLFKVTINWGRG